MITTEPSDRTIVLHLLRGAIPEQADEISRLWNEYDHAVNIIDSGKGVVMNADASRIQSNRNAIDVFWLFGFSAWRSIEVYYPALFASTTSCIALDQALSIDRERARYEFDYKQCMASALALIEAENTSQISWPQDVPRPTADRESVGDVQHKAAFDLVGLALAFAFLHEFRHVMFYMEKNVPSILPEEEIACDAWARDFMMRKLGDYARENGCRYEDVLGKRATGVALAAVIIHALTPTHARWGNRQYPPIAERLTAMIAGYNLPAGSSFWSFTACLLIALMRQDNRPLDITPASNREVVEALIQRLR